MGKIIFYTVLCLLSVCSTVRAEPLEIQTAKGIITFNVDIASDPDSRKKGLQGRTTLCPLCGMLFVFDREELPRFWMQDTAIPLDMVYIDSSGVVKGIHEGAKPYDLTPIDPPAPSLAVLEIRGNTAKTLGIAAGDKVLHKVFEKDLK